MNNTANPFSDMEDDLDFGAPVAPTVAEVVYFEQACSKCGGSGTYMGYSRYGMQCFACKGKGKLTFKTSPADRAKARASAVRRTAAKAEAQAAKAQEWKVANPAEAAWLVASAGSFEFARSLLEALNKHGSLTEKQLATVQRLALQSAERMTARAAEQAARVQAAPALSVQAIEVAFNNAKQAGIKYPKLRLESFIFSPAGEFSKNPGAIYVKHKADDTYLGKVMGGRLFTSRECTPDAQERIIAVASDPKQAAIAYGQKYGSCAVCGRALTDKTSVELGIGPVCAEKYGF